MTEEELIEIRETYAFATCGIYERDRSLDGEPCLNCGWSYEAHFVIPQLLDHIRELEAKLGAF